MRSDKAVLALLFAFAAQPQTFAAPQSEETHWEAPARTRQIHSPVPVNRSLLGRGEDVYGQFCASCHGDEGDGRGWLAGNLAELPPDLGHASEEHTPGELVWKIETGRGLMPGWERVLTEADIWALAAHIERLGQGEAHAGEESPHAE